MLHLHCGEDLTLLAGHLGKVLADAPPDPMQPDLVTVPSAGMRTWLSLQLATRLGTGSASAGVGAHRDGVSANIGFPFPGELRLRVLAAGDEHGAGSDWDVQRLVWAILGVADGVRDGVAQGEEARPGVDGGLPAVLTGGDAGSSRYAAARRVADLFDRYHLHRPEMVMAWADGSDLDGLGAPLQEHHLWQPRLWRSVRALLGTPSPPERMASLMVPLRSGDLVVDLPERVCAFGMSLLPGGAGFIDLAAALAQHREVHLFVIGPSPMLAERFRSSSREQAGGSPGDVAAADELPAGDRPGPPRHRQRKQLDPIDALHHPLLRSWGRLHYETAAVLEDARSAGLADPESEVTDEPTSGDEGEALRGAESTDGPADTLLGRLKADVRSDRAPAGYLHGDHGALRRVGHRFATVEFHACHGAGRQIEVLGDTIWRLLAENPHLQEDDVLVVCPDLERFAPMIEATLGASAPTGAPSPSSEGPLRLRYRLADRSLSASTPLVAAFSTLLDLVAGRFDAPSVLDFLSLEPVRQRYGIGDDELAAITEWVVELNVRWGLDPASRETHGIPAAITTNTWQAAVDRLLLGVGVGDPTIAGGDEPSVGLADTIGGVVQHGIEGSDVVVAGRLAEVMWRLAEFAALIEQERRVADWVLLLQRAATTFFDVPREQSWQLDRLLCTLDAIAESGRRAAEPGTSGEPVAESATPLSFTDVRHLVAERLDSVEGRPAFMRGGVTVSSLTPLRWVPHKVIVMLGMDAPALSVSATDGDDLVAAAPLVGDRDRRSELRQAMLETLMSAGEHLVVIRDGNDLRTNQPVPMPVAVAELRDALATMVAPDFRGEFLAQLEVHHPRQPFDESYFRFDGEVPHPGIPSSVPRSFDSAAATAARARRRRVGTIEAFGAEPLDAPNLEVIHLADLQRFLKNPIRHFVERRLEVRLPRSEDAPTGVFTVALDGLDTWGLGERLLGHLGSHDDPAAATAIWREIESRTGAVPPGRIGDDELRKVEIQVLDLHSRVRELGVHSGAARRTVPVEVELGDGTRVIGSVALRLDPTPDDPRSGPALVRFVRRRPEHAQAVWVELAALALTRPEDSWRAVVATRHESGKHTVEGMQVAKVHVDRCELDPDDPAGAARSCLETVVGLYRRGMCEPLPLFRKLSAKIHAAPSKLPDWPDRFADAAEVLAFGHLSAAEICQIPVRGDDPAGRADDRLRRYADHLYSQLAATLVQESS